MADLSDFLGDIDWENIAGQILAGLAKNENFSLDGVRQTVVAGATQAHAAKMSAAFKFIEWIANNLGKALVDVEEPFMPVIAAFTAPIVGGMFGADISADAFASRSNSGARGDAARALVDAFTAILAGGDDGPIGASDEGAKRIASAGLHAAIEGWFMGAVPELLSDVLPFEFGHFEAFTKLPDEVISALGIGRLVRRALTPLVNATAVEPMKRFTNAKYRPTQLSPAEISQQLARGNIGDDDARARLAEHGYRDDDMDAVLFQAVKFRGAAELELLVRIGKVSRADAIRELTSVGWSEDAAGSLLDAANYKRIETFEAAMADGAVAAFADGRIDDVTLGKYTTGLTITEQHGAQLRELAAAKRQFHTKPLTPAEAKQCVLDDILAVQDYRDVLDAAGYSENAADALELLLRKQLDDKRTTAQHKSDLAAQKQAAAEQRANDTADARKRVDAARALKRRGPIAELERAVIRGLIPVSRLSEVLSAEFDDDTVTIIVQDVQGRRDAFVAQQAKAANASKKAGNSGLSIAQLQTALTDRVLTIDQITPQLLDKGLSPEDVAVLEQTMSEAASAKQAAAALRAKVAQRTATKPLSLATAEALVKGGHWTLAQFDDYLAAQGYDVADVANLNALMRDALAKTKAAQSIEAATAAADPGKGLTLAQFKSAVVLGQKTLADYGAFLTTQGYSADATATLAAEAASALATADAARQRRAATTAGLDGSAVSLADVTRAAQLGLVTRDQYAAALRARGYSDDDIALELDLLDAEIAAKTKLAPAAGTAEALMAGAAGSALSVATAKHVQIDGELAKRGLSIATVEKAVKDGLSTLDEYQAWLEANGFGQADAQLLRALLASTLPAPDNGAATP